MEGLIKQTRSRFAGTRQDNKEERSSTTVRKTQSFKEREKGHSWIKRQFSREMISSDYDFNGDHYPAAVAAAAYAIQSLEESKPNHRKETTYGPDKSSKKMKSALKSSDQTSKTSFKKRVSFANTNETISYKPEKPALEKDPEKVAPSMKRTPTFADNQLNKTDSKKNETTVSKPNHPTAQAVETRKQNATKPEPEDSQADAWEKEEMTSIKERYDPYDKLKATIENWEIQKKRNVTRKIQRIEAELDKRRAESIQSHRNEITRLEEIAGKARAQAKENQEKEEFKVKEKANKIRLTGEIPETFWCF